MTPSLVWRGAMRPQLDYRGRELHSFLPLSPNGENRPVTGREHGRRVGCSQGEQLRCNPCSYRAGALCFTSGLASPESNPVDHKP
jgi:hypothetical protein